MLAASNQEGMDADEMTFVTVANTSVEDSALVRSVIPPGNDPPCSLVLLTGGEPPKPSSQRTDGPGCQERERPQASQTMTMADESQLPGGAPTATASPPPVAFQGASHTLGSASTEVAEEGGRVDPRARMLAAAEARARTSHAGV